MRSAILVIAGSSAPTQPPAPSTAGAGLCYPREAMAHAMRILMTICLAVILSGCLQLKFTGLEGLRHRACVADTGLLCED